MKKIISMILVALLFMTGISTTTFATTPDVCSSFKDTYVVNTFYASGIEQNTLKKVGQNNLGQNEFYDHLMNHIQLTGKTTDEITSISTNESLFEVVSAYNGSSKQYYLTYFGNESSSSKMIPLTISFLDNTSYVTNSTVKLANIKPSFTLSKSEVTLLNVSGNNASATFSINHSYYKQLKNISEVTLDLSKVTSGNTYALQKDEYPTENQPYQLNCHLTRTNVGNIYNKTDRLGIVIHFNNSSQTITKYIIVKPRPLKKVALKFNKSSISLEPKGYGNPVSYDFQNIAITTSPYYDGDFTYTIYDNRNNIVTKDHILTCKLYQSGAGRTLQIMADSEANNHINKIYKVKIGLKEKKGTECTLSEDTIPASGIIYKTISVKLFHHEPSVQRNVINVNLNKPAVSGDKTDRLAVTFKPQFKYFNWDLGIPTISGNDAEYFRILPTTKTGNVSIYPTLQGLNAPLNNEGIKPGRTYNLKLTYTNTRGEQISQTLIYKTKNTLASAQTDRSKNYTVQKGAETQLDFGSFIPDYLTIANNDTENCSVKISAANSATIKKNFSIVAYPERKDTVTYYWIHTAYLKMSDSANYKSNQIIRIKFDIYYIGRPKPSQVTVKFTVK